MVETLDKVKKGDTLKFTGYEEQPESGTVLEVNTLCEVKAVERDDQGLTFTVIADNPTFDSGKKETAKNAKHVEVELFDTEVAPVAKPKTSTRKSAAKKTTAKEKPAAKSTTAKKPLKTTTSHSGAAKEKARAEAKAKPAAKAKAAPKAKAKPKAETSESKEVESYEPEWGTLKTEDEEILAVVQEQGENLIDYTKSLVEQRSAASYTLGGMLYHIQLTGDYRLLSPDYEDGNGGFMKFVDSELGFGYRSAKYLIDIYVKFNHYKLGHKVAQIGWTKATKIVDALKKFSKANDGKDMTKAEVNKLITKASKSTVKELEEAINEEYKTDTPDKVKFHKVSFSLPEERAVIVEDIIKRAMEHFDTDSMGVAIESALTEWATEMLED